MSADHQELRRLMLTIEDLEGEEERVAREHLESCGSCREILASVREMEGRARSMRSIPIDVTLDPEIEAEERSSHRRLATRVGLTEDPRRSLGERIRRTLRVRPLGLLIPALAAASLTIVLLRPAQRAIVDVELVPGVRTRSEGLRTWRAGDEVTLEIELARLAAPIVVHIDDKGVPTLLHPPDGRPRPLEPGRHRLPRESSDEAWILEGTGERSTFLVAASGDAELDAHAIVEEAARRAAPAGDRERAIQEIRRVIERHVGSTSRQDLVVDPR